MMELDYRMDNAMSANPHVVGLYFIRGARGG